MLAVCFKRNQHLPPTLAFLHLRKTLFFSFSLASPLSSTLPITDHRQTQDTHTHTNQNARSHPHSPHLRGPLLRRCRRVRLCPSLHGPPRRRGAPGLSDRPLGPPLGAQHRLLHPGRRAGHAACQAARRAYRQAHRQPPAPREDGQEPRRQDREELRPLHPQAEGVREATKKGRRESSFLMGGSWNIPTYMHTFLLASIMDARSGCVQDVQTLRWWRPGLSDCLL